jgi:hypothetical protein
MKAIVEGAVMPGLSTIGTTKGTQPRYPTIVQLHMLLVYDSGMAVRFLRKRGAYLLTQSSCVTNILGPSHAKRASYVPAKLWSLMTSLGMPRSYTFASLLVNSATSEIRHNWAQYLL